MCSPQYGFLPTMRYLASFTLRNATNYPHVLIHILQLFWETESNLMVVAHWVTQPHGASKSMASPYERLVQHPQIEGGSATSHRQGAYSLLACVQHGCKSVLTASFSSRSADTMYWKANTSSRHQHGVSPRVR